MVKYSLTKKEEKLLQKARYYQDKSGYYHRKFADSLQNRFYNSKTIEEFEDWDLWTLCESGDSSEDQNELNRFWNEVKKECNDD